MKLWLTLEKFFASTGFANLSYGNIIMFIAAAALIYLGIKKHYEPLLLVPIGFGIILANIPGALMGAYDKGGLMYYIYKGVDLSIFPPLVFLGIGAMTDFYCVLARPKLILLGAAAQFGIFAALFGAILMGFDSGVASAIGIIGGADGPTSVFVASELAPELLGPISIAAYSYMALVPVIQPPIMKLLTTKEERRIHMSPPREVSRMEKIIFPFLVAAIIILIAPKSAPLIGMIAFGNILKESGVTDRLAEVAGGSFVDTVTILLTLSIGSSASASVFLTAQSLKIFALGAFAFAVSTATGVLFGKLMNYLSEESINPLIGAAGVSAVPDSARVAQMVAQQEDPSNHILLHAMGPNVAGTMGSATAAGILLAMIG